MANRPHLQVHGAGGTWVVRGLLVALIVATGYLIFEFGRIRAGYDIIDAANEHAAFEDQIRSLDEEIVALEQEVALIETHREIDSAAYSEVEASLASLQAKIQEQRDAIAFYRGIVSPADGRSGLRVQDLKLTRAGSERVFNVRLVLVQARQHDRKVTGDVNLIVQGSQGGVETEYSFAQLATGADDKDWRFSFRYFQDFNRQLVLPDGFKPERIRVEVLSKTRSIKSIEESYAWVTSQS